MNEQIAAAAVAYIEALIALNSAERKLYNEARQQSPLRLHVQHASEHWLVRIGAGTKPSIVAERLSGSIRADDDGKVG